MTTQTETERAAPENVTDVEKAPPEYSSDPPPSYDLVFGKVRQLRDEADGKADFAKKLMSCVFCGTVTNMIMTAFMLGIPISSVVFGALYLHQCPRQRYIPIYLVVAGVFGLIKGILGVAQILIKKNTSDEDEQPAGTKVIRFIDGPISCFLLAWFITGSVWIYGIHGKYSSIPTSSDFCDPTLYLFAFWILTIQYIIALTSVLCCCISGVVICCMVAGQE